MNTTDAEKSKNLEKENINISAVASNVVGSFSSDVIREILSSQFEDTKTKINNDTSTLVCELIKTLTCELTLRSCMQVLKEGGTCIDLEHVEKCLPQIMLDFP